MSPEGVLARSAMAMSRSLEPQHDVRLRSTTLWTAASRASVTCQKGALSVFKVCVKSLTLPLMARLAPLAPAVVLWRAVPPGARFDGVEGAWLVSNPTAGGATPFNQFWPGANASAFQSAGSSVALVGTRISGREAINNEDSTRFWARPNETSSFSAGNGLNACRMLLASTSAR